MMAVAVAAASSSSSSTQPPFPVASHSSSNIRWRFAKATQGGKPHSFLPYPSPPPLHNHCRPLIISRKAILSLDSTAQQQPQPPRSVIEPEEDEEKERAITTAAEEEEEEETKVSSELLPVVISGDRHSRYPELLKQCKERRSTRALHAHMVKRGVAHSTSLVNAYSKCGSIEDARHLFDQIPRPSVVTWTSLLVGYVRNSRPHLAVQLFVDHLHSGLLQPTTYTLSTILRACSSTSSRVIGGQIHGYAVKIGASPTDTILGNALVRFYSSCRQLGCALRVFRYIPDKDTISWTTVISACGENGRALLGLRLFRDMLLDPQSPPNELTLTTAAGLCSASHAVSIGRQVHSMCIKFGIHSSPPVSNSLMYLYLKCDRLRDARTLIPDFHSLKNLITWNSLISGYAKLMDLAKEGVSAHLRGLEALDIFSRLDRSPGITPDSFSYSSALTVCSGLSALHQGEQFHARTIKMGHSSDVVVGCSVVNMYVKCGCVDEASRFFVEMPTRTLILWTSMIAGFSQYGRPEEALRMFDDMRLLGLKPNHITFISVLCACSHLGLVEEAQEYFSIMKEEYHIRPMLDHYVCLVEMFARLGRLDEAFEVVGTMELEPNEVLWTILLGGCTRYGHMDLALYVADRLLELKPLYPETYGFLLNLYISAEMWQDVSRIRNLMGDEKIGRIVDWSWISIRDKVHSFRADDGFLTQSTKMRDFLEDLLEKAKGMGYLPRRSFHAADEEARVSSAVHHSEVLAVVFGLMNTIEGAAIRVVKNTIMCGDSHDALKFFSVLTGREIMVRDRRRLHIFKEGRCSGGDLSAPL